MDNYICFLITVMMQQTKTLIRCALKIKADDIPSACAEYPMEPENRAWFCGQLPEHCKVGPVVEVQEIFEVVDKS